MRAIVRKQWLVVRRLRAGWERVTELWTLHARYVAELESRDKERQRWRARCERSEALVEDLRAKAVDAGDAPGLTAAEIERLALLADAAGHVAAEAGWVLRAGWAAPEDGIPNRVAVERVLGRLRCVINLMHDAGDVRGKELCEWQRKFRRILAETTRYQQITAEPRERER